MKYILIEDNLLELYYEVISDKDIIINFINYFYFNLCGYLFGDVFNYKIMINVDKFIVNDKYFIFIGEIRNVDGIFMDFRILIFIGVNINSDYE